MKRLERLRWGALGLRGRLVGAVIGTTIITLAVAAVVLLPRLEDSLRSAAQKTLKGEVRAVEHFGAISEIAKIPYPEIALQHVNVKHPDKQTQQVIDRARYQAGQMAGFVGYVERTVGASFVGVVGYIDQHGAGRIVWPPPNPATKDHRPASHQDTDRDVGPVGPGVTDDVADAYQGHHTVYSFGNIQGHQVVRAAIPLTHRHKREDAVLIIRKSIDEIPAAVDAVRRAFEIAALIAIGLMLMLAIPLAGTLVRRLRRLREAALQMAVGGSGAALELPTDRTRDEVGDLARSFSIMQRRLRHQEQARRGFVATASHELRTPLASLNGMLELLEEDLQSENPDLEDAARLLDRARAQSLRLSRLAADLLDLSRIDAQVELRSEPLELGELVRAVLAEFEIPIRERGVSAVLRDSDEQVWVMADPGSVARILRILLDNSLRVAPRGSEVAVTIVPGERPTLSVSDRGPGVAQDERALIFERFKRGTETGGQAGFGLGLAIGRELAERMGGTLVLRDDAEQGATFTLTLRRANARTAESASTPA